MDNHQYVNQTSGKTEWYSPPELVEAARRAMGGIDLDPASSDRANAQIVKADRIYTRPDYSLIPATEGYDCEVRHYETWGGLSRWWFGKVWLNHPFGSGERPCNPGCTKKTCEKRGWHTFGTLPGNDDWITKVVAEFHSGQIEAACVLTYAAMSEAWFKPLKQFPMCLIDGRVNYLDPETLEPVKGVPKGSVITYLGHFPSHFYREFKQFGAVYVPYDFLRP